MILEEVPIEGGCWFCLVPTRKGIHGTSRATGQACFTFLCDEHFEKIERRVRPESLDELVPM